MKTSLTICIALVIVGCSQRAQEPAPPVAMPVDGVRETFQGIAENWKVGAFLAGPNIWIDLPTTHWPAKVVGKSVEVKGVLVERHDLPVFVADPNREPIAGITVAPGTDLHEASKRYVLEHVEWAAVGDRTDRQRTN